MKNLTKSETAQILLAHDNYAIVTHRRPDGDTIGSALAVRAVPDYLDTGDVEAALLELARRIRVTGSANPKAARDELLHTMACKAAIKGGQKNGRAELEEVAELVMSGAVKYCPHGRPVAIEMTKYQLEKQFKRA